MARDEKSIYKKPVIIPLGDVEKTLGVSPHCRSGTVPGPPSGEGDCQDGIGAFSQQQAGCAVGTNATSGGALGCLTGYNATP